MGGLLFAVLAPDLLSSRDASRTLPFPMDGLCECIAGSLPRRLLLRVPTDIVSRLSNSIVVSTNHYRVPNRAEQCRSERRRWTTDKLLALPPYAPGQDSTRCSARLSTSA